MKVFIAGHDGMVGSSVVRNAPSTHELITINKSQLDLRDQVKVSDFLKKTRPDAVILAAAKVGGILENARHQRSMLVENICIQTNVMEASANLGIQNFVFLGSSCIYPKKAIQPITESSLLTGSLEPTNEGYAIAKIAGIRLAKAISDECGLNYFSLMPTNLFGPNDQYDLEEAHVPAALIRRFHEAKVNNLSFVKLWGTGKPLREFMHVDDLADAIWFFLDLEKIGGSIINIGSGHELSIADFSKLVASVIGYSGEIGFDDTNPDGAPRKRLDLSYADKLGWSAKLSMESSLESTYHWYVNALSKGKIRGI